MKKFLKAVAAVLALYVVASVLLGWYVTRSYKPSAPRDRGSMGFEVQEVELKASDGAKIRAWYAPGPGGSPAIALFHGYRESRAEMIPIARALNIAGYDLLLPDFRGCGESEGDGPTFGVREALDVTASVKFLQDDRSHLARRVGVLGIGTGASAVILANETVKECGAAALLAPYDALDATLDRRAHAKAGIGVMPLGFLAAEVVARKVGRPLSSVRPIDLIARLYPCPILIVGADKDPITPRTEIQALFDRAREPKEMYVVDNVPRERLTDLYQSLLRGKLVEFFDQTLR